MTLANPAQQPDPGMEELLEQLRAMCLPPPAERRAIRRAARFSLKEVAELVGVDEMTISRWERGVSRPWPRHVAAYRKVLAVLAAIVREQQTQK